MFEDIKQTPHALTLAYRCVKDLGWTHVRLCHEFGITYPTLRRIRSGQLGRTQTDEYCLQVFVTIIDNAYRADLEATGGEHAIYYLRMLRAILRAQLHLKK